jgi:hypothetical protein
MIKTVGAAGGVAAVGSGAVSQQNSPIQTAAAASKCKAALMGAAWFTGVSGLKDCFPWSSDPDIDENDAARLQVYKTVNALANERGGPGGFRTSLIADFKDAPTDESAYSYAAWSEWQTAAALETLSGNSQSDAESAAMDALRAHTTRTIINHVEAWNNAVTTLIENGTLVQTIEENLDGGSDGAINMPTTNYNGYVKAPTSSEIASIDGDGEISPVEVSQVESGGYCVWELTVPDNHLPTHLGNLDDREEQLTVLAPAGYDTGGGKNLAVPYRQWVFDDAWQTSSTDSPYNPSESIKIKSTHPDVDKTVLGLDGEAFYYSFRKIENEYGNMQSNLSDYVAKLHNGLDQGSIDPSAVLSATDLVKEFDPTNQRSQMAREALAVGMGMPNAIGYQAKVSHPDLAADSLWGDLYIRFSDSAPDDYTIDGPMTIPSADYEMALLGYPSSVSDEYRKVGMDAASGDLEILEIETNDQIVVDDPAKSVKSGGTVVLAPADSEETPKPLADSDPATDKWGIIVTAGDGTSDKQTVGDAYVEDQKWKLDTSLSEGLSVAEIRYTPPVVHTKTGYTVSDPANYDPEKTQQILEETRRINEEIEKLLSGGIGGGGFFDGGLPSLPGLSTMQSAVVVVLGIAALSAASS